MYYFSFVYKVGMILNVISLIDVFLRLEVWFIEYMYQLEYPGDWGSGIFMLFFFETTELFESQLNIVDH